MGKKGKTMTIWIAESDNGSIQFDTCPSRSDIRNSCEDFDGVVEVFEVTVQEISREKLFEVDDY